MSSSRSSGTSSETESSNPAGSPQVYDLYADLFSRRTFTEPTTGLHRAIQTQAAPAPAPRSPTTLADSGLSMGQLCDLILKTLYIHGVMQGADISKSTRLPFNIVDESLRTLRDQKLIEVASGDMVGRITYRFALTDVGRTRARDSFENCRYVGPAPVPLEQYVEHCRMQHVTGTACNPASLRNAFKDFVIRPSMLDELGPAVCSGKSIFVYGPPGNGKTVIAKGLGQFLNMFGGEIYVPYAILAENSIITVYDPGIHQTTDDADLTQRGMVSTNTDQSSYLVHDSPVDIRWRRIKRPVVITGGELTLDMLELQYSKTANFYNAPLHIKANGGVFLIDDFGRQIVRPKDLLNRWIVPLEERVDYLSLTTGRKFMLPFEQLIIFSTNLDPKELVDDAFLRRIKHKIRIDPPNRELFSVIFQLVCRQREIPYVEAVVDSLFVKYYDKGRTPRSSDPRDLLDMAQSICRFHDRPISLTDELIDECARRFFGEI